MQSQQLSNGLDLLILLLWRHWKEWTCDCCCCFSGFFSKVLFSRNKLGVIRNYSTTILPVEIYQKCVLLVLWYPMLPQWLLISNLSMATFQYFHGALPLPSLPLARMFLFPSCWAMQFGDICPRLWFHVGWTVRWKMTRRLLFHLQFAASGSLSQLSSPWHATAIVGCVSCPFQAFD